MRPLCSADHMLPAHRRLFSRGHGCHRQLHRFGPHDFEPGAPNVTAGPISPKDRGTWQETWELGESVFRLEKGCRGNHLIGRDGPENGTDPSWFGGGRAFLTLGTQRTCATITDASRIQQTVRTIALRSAFLRIERMVGRTKERAIRLKGKSGSWEASRKGSACPLRGAILHSSRWRLSGSRLDGGSRGSIECGSKFAEAHLGGGQMLSQFQAKIPHPLTDHLPEFLPTRRMRNPTIGVLFLIFVSQDGFE